MPNFFRNLRRPAIPGENKIKRSNYLKYAIGEIFLVVVGILIALSVNNWNTKKEFANWEEQFLQDLHNELQANLTQSQTVDSIQYTIGKSLVSSIEILENDEVSDTPLDSIYTIIQKLNPTFFPTSGVYNTSLASGKIEGIENNALKYEIMNLYNRYYQRTVYNGEILDQVVEKVDWDILKYWNPRTEKFKRLKSDDKLALIKLLDFHLEQNQVYIEVLKQNIEENQKVIDQISSEIKD